jgi:hypothetical protein
MWTDMKAPQDAAWWAVIVLGTACAVTLVVMQVIAILG